MTLFRISLENNQLNDSLSVYPNPFTDQFTLYVQSSGNDNLTISIINSTGIKFFETEKEVTTGMNTIVISDLVLPPAVYYVRITGLSIKKTITGYQTWKIVFIFWL